MNYVNVLSVTNKIITTITLCQSFFFPSSLRNSSEAATNKWIFNENDLSPEIFAGNGKHHHIVMSVIMAPFTAVTNSRKLIELLFR